MSEVGIAFDTKMGPVKLQRVLYEGTDRLQAGYGLCYNQDYVGDGADEADYGRTTRVEKPSTTNLNHFAGVVAIRSHMPSGSTGPGWIWILRPGSVCRVFTDQNLALGNRITVHAGTYIFSEGGLPGRGSAIAMETEDLSTDNAIALARLEDGPESGLCEELTAVDNVAMTNPMVGGVTRFLAVDLATGDSDATLADGLFYGQRKAFVVVGLQDNNDIDLTITTPEAAGSDHIAFDAVDEVAFLEWMGNFWKIVGYKGCVVS